MVSNIYTQRILCTETLNQLNLSLFLLCLDVLTVLFLSQHNVLIDDEGTPHLSDFGRSKLIEHRGFTTATLAGSARQMAPELVPGDENPTDSDEHKLPKLTKDADVYSFSMVALEVSDPYN
jgi:serine/threonine protein kinase